MRAKTINELQNFERNKDTKSAIGVGKAREAKDILEKMLNSDRRPYIEFDINIKNLDNIIITYSKDLINRYNNEEGKDLQKYKWIIKYYETEQFEVEDYYNEGTFMNHITRDNDWNINMIEQSGGGPDNLTSRKTYICKVSKNRRDGKDSKELAEALVEGLKSKYGKTVWLFETISPKKSSD